MPQLADLTSLRLGGPAARFVEAHTEDELVELVREADAADDPVLVLAGGSNVVVADDGFPGTVVHVLTRGVERDGAAFTVQAGEPWDAFVAARVEDGLAGIECLSGIPGSIGATPIQNVGAYGQEVREVITSVRVLNRGGGEVAELTPAECGFTYRSSAFKREPGQWVVLSVSFQLDPQPDSRPIRYAELARALGIELDESAPLADVREAVLSLRRGKGMVIDPDDPDSVSAGSFFTNPILDPAHFEELEKRVAADLGADAKLPSWPEPDGQVKTSAAWLVERAGFGRGYGAPGPIMVSTKHSLALTNRGGGTTAELLELAHEIQAGVRTAVRRRAPARARVRGDYGRLVRVLTGAAPRRARAGPGPRRAPPSPAARRRGTRSPSRSSLRCRSRPCPTWRIRSITPWFVFTFCTRSSLASCVLRAMIPRLDVKAMVRDRVGRPDPDEEPDEHDDREDRRAHARCRARVGDQHRDPPDDRATRAPFR